MSRPYTPLTLEVLKKLSGAAAASARELKNEFCPEKPTKFFSSLIYRLQKDGLVEKVAQTQDTLRITQDGLALIKRQKPERDGVWKLVIFDIPEKHKYVRNFLRAKLKSLHFQKWQNSIWVSPYALDEEIEAELKNLAKKFFVRLIKTQDINEIQDLEKLFG